MIYDSSIVTGIRWEKKPKHTDNELMRVLLKNLKFEAENLVNDYSTSDSTQNVNAIPAKN